MSDIHVYTFEDSEGSEQSFDTQDYREAKAYAVVNKYKLIVNVFEYSDSYMLEDHTEKDNPARRET